jgi:hypothetical protein
MMSTGRRHIQRRAGATIVFLFCTSAVSRLVIGRLLTTAAGATISLPQHFLNS